MPISQSKVGIIYPPPEVRTIVDKTASFVARNGPEFQEKIRQNEISNPKFNFLNENDPYHAYYLHKVKEITENKGQDVVATQIPVMQKLSLTTKTQEQQTKIKEQMFIPKEPPPEFEYIIDSAPVSALDIDLIKLTAQFVARNGRPFLTSLMGKEQRNGMFDFLKPQHSHFSYFTRLVEQYTKILIPHKDLTERLRNEIENPFNILKDVLYRVEWQKYQQREKAREDELIEKERVAYSQIDWHDFVVVETVDYQPNEIGNFPPPTTPEDVGALVVQQERIETSGDRGYSASLMERIIEDESRAEIPQQLTTTQMMNEISLAPPVNLDHNGHENNKHSVPDKNIDEVAMDEDSDNEEDQHVTSESIQQKLNALNKEKSGVAPTLPMPKSDLPLPPNPETVIIRKDYNPKAKQTATADAEKYFISPITGERIPASSVQEHMRISLLDPKWIEQKEKEKREKEEQEGVLAPGVSIDKQLKQLADYRRDIFGRGADETIIGKKIGEEEKKKDDKAIWDGHTATMELASKRKMDGITLEEQIKSIHQSQGFADDESTVKIGPTVPKPTIITSQSITTGAVISAPPQQPQAVISNYSYRLQKPVDSSSILVRPPGMSVGSMPPNPQLIRPVQMLAPTQYMPPMAVPQPPIVTVPPPIEPVELVEEPPMKKVKTEDQLIPEAEYLERFGGADSAVSFNVQVPNIPDKSEWNLNGQVVQFTLPLTELVSVLKTKLSEILGMPIAKQKLQFEGMFIKDSNSLAYYNLANDSIIYLQMKERGGRKK